MTFVDPLTMAGKGYSRTKNIISEKKNKTALILILIKQRRQKTGEICVGVE